MVELGTTAQAKHNMPDEFACLSMIAFAISISITDQRSPPCTISIQKRHKSSVIIGTIFGIMKWLHGNVRRAFCCLPFARQCADIYLYYRPLLGRKGSEIFESINGCMLLHWNPSIDGMPVSSPFFLS